MSYKKGLVLLLAAGIVFGSTGCSLQPVEANASLTENQQTAADMPPLDKNAPKHIKVAYQRLGEMLQNQDRHIFMTDMAKIGNAYVFTFEDSFSSCAYITVPCGNEAETDAYEKSFTCVFPDGSSYLIDSLAAGVFMLCNTGLSYEDAETLTWRLRAGEKYNFYSEVKQEEDFSVFFRPKDADGSITLVARHKGEFWNGITNDGKNIAEDYSGDPIDYDFYTKAACNQGSKCSVLGTVETWEQKELIADRYAAFATLRLETGEAVRCMYDYDKTPVSFRVDDSYTFYGTLEMLDEEPVFQIDFAEKVS